MDCSDLIGQKQITYKPLRGCYTDTRLMSQHLGIAVRFSSSHSQTSLKPYAGMCKYIIWSIHNVT